MTAPDFDAMELDAARAFAREAYKEAHEARKQRDWFYSALSVAVDCLEVYKPDLETLPRLQAIREAGAK